MEGRFPLRFWGSSGFMSTTRHRIHHARISTVERDAGQGLVTNEIPCGLSSLISDSRKLDEDMIDMMQTIIFLPVQDAVDQMTQTLTLVEKRWFRARSEFCNSTYHSVQRHGPYLPPSLPFPPEPCTSPSVPLGSLNKMQTMQLLFSLLYSRLMRDKGRSTSEVVILKSFPLRFYPSKTV